MMKRLLDWIIPPKPLAQEARDREILVLLLFLGWLLSLFL